MKDAKKRFNFIKDSFYGRFKNGWPLAKQSLIVKNCVLLGRQIHFDTKSLFT